MSLIGISGLIGVGTTNVGGVDTKLQIWGLYHLVGLTVSAFIDGQDAGDYTVAADGSITINTPGTGYNITPATLIASNGDYGESTTPLSVNAGAGAVATSVGIVIGQPFVSQGQRLRPATAADVGAQTGPALGMTRRTHQFAVLVQDGVIVKFGTSLTPTPNGNMDQATFKQADQTTDIAAGAMFSGVYWSPAEDSYSYESALCWQIDRPWPCTIVATSQFLHGMER